MTSIMQSSARKKQGKQKLCQLSCSGSAVENGGKFITFCEKEKAEILPKNIVKKKKTAKYNSTHENCFLKKYLLNHCNPV